MTTITSPLILPEDKQDAEHRLKLLHAACWIASGLALVGGVTAWALTH